MTDKNDMPALRRVTDLAELMQWRAEVVRHVFGVEPDAELLEANRSYYECHIEAGSHYAVVAETVTGQEAGCGAVCFSEELPSPDNPTGRCAYLMNIYVRCRYRRRGIAHAIVRHLVEEALRRGCGKIYLETTAEGKPVYASVGFGEMPDMMKYAQTVESGGVDGSEEDGVVSRSIK